MKTLACYRLDDVLLSQLGEISGPDDHVPLGTVPLDWLITRVVGAGDAAGNFADICHSEWLSEIATRAGFRGADMSSLQSPQRGLTQALSGEIYRDTKAYGGIRYPSRFGHDIENWAIYDRVTVTGTESEIASLDADLAQALRLLRITLETEP